MPTQLVVVLGKVLLWTPVALSFSHLNPQVQTLQSEIDNSHTPQSNQNWSLRPRKTPPHNDRRYLEIAPTEFFPQGRPLTKDLEQAFERDVHPEEDQSSLGSGVFLTRDWRQAYHNYESPPDDPDLIDSETGAASYVMEVEGILPNDLHGVLYRNGPGQFGRNGHRVQHTLDGDALILKITIPPPSDAAKGGTRNVLFQSRFVETETFLKERRADRYLLRGTFGSGPRGDDKGPGLNEDPVKSSVWERILHNALKIDVKNPANTHLVAYGGKLLALFEAGLPHRIDPTTLHTLGEDNLNGVIPCASNERGEPKGKLAVTMKSVPSTLLPDYLGGAAHTAHPKMCSRTGNMVGWHWQQVADTNALRVTFTEWSNKGELGAMSVIGSSTFDLPGCSLAPHDMALTENYIVLLTNALSLDRIPFLSGIRSAAASLKMDGRAPVKAYIFPRPSDEGAFEEQQEFPIVIDDVPACFSIHISHAFEDDQSRNIVMYFSGWPPSDSKDFLGAWGGFAPMFNKIPATFLWRLKLDPFTQKCTSLKVAPGCENVCLEHPVCHPAYSTRSPNFTYAVLGNLIGDSTAPCGYGRMPTGNSRESNLVFSHPEDRVKGVRNEDIDCYFFGSRYFAGEPLIVPKVGSNAVSKNELQAYLLGMVNDCAFGLSFVAVFDLERPLRDGPICKLWLKSNTPRGLHGCFVPTESATSYESSYFG